MFDAIRKKVSSYVPKLELPKVSLPNPAAAVQKGMQVAKDVYAGAAKTAGQVASSVIPDKAQALGAARGFYDGVNRAADTFGHALRDGGAAVTRAGKALDGFVPNAREIRQVGKAITTLGKGIADAPETAAAAAGQMHRDALALYDRGQKLYDGAATLVEKATKPAKEGLRALGEGLGWVKQAAEDFGRSVVDAVDYKKNIAALGEGDKYKVGVGGSISVEGLKGYGKGSAEIQLKDGEYVITADGELGGGLYAEAGGKLGPLKAGADASALLGVGGKVEFKFKTKEEAEKAFAIIMKQGAALAAASSSAAGPLGQVAAKALQPSAEELRFLSKGMSAVELKGNAAAEATAALGLKAIDTNGLAGKAAVKVEQAVRIDFRKGELSVKNTVSGELGVSAGLTIGNGKEGKAGKSAGPGTLFNGKGEVKVEAEQTFTLPKNIDPLKLAINPGGELARHAEAMGKTRKDKVTLTAEGQLTGLGNGGGAAIEVTMNQSFDSLVKSGFGPKLFAGDVKGALRAVGNATDVEVKIEPYRQYGVSMSPGLSVMGFGIGAELEATRKDVTPDKNPWKGNATQAWGHIERFLMQNQPLKPVPVLRANS